MYAPFITAERIDNSNSNMKGDSTRVHDPLKDTEYDNEHMITWIANLVEMLQLNFLQQC